MTLADLRAVCLCLLVLTSGTPRAIAEHRETTHRPPSPLSQLISLPARGGTNQNPRSPECQLIPPAGHGRTTQNQRSPRSQLISLPGHGGTTHNPRSPESQLISLPGHGGTTHNHQPPESQLISIPGHGGTTHNPQSPESQLISLPGHGGTTHNHQPPESQLISIPGHGGTTHTPRSPESQRISIPGHGGTTHNPRSPESQLISLPGHGGTTNNPRSPESQLISPLGLQHALPDTLNELAPHTSRPQYPHNESPTVVKSGFLTAVEMGIHTAVESQFLTAVDSESPTAVDAETPTAVDYESPTAVGFEAPTAVDYESPTAVGFESPTAVDSESPTAVDSESRTAVDSESPRAVVDSESPTAVDSEYPTTVDSGFTALIDSESPAYVSSESPTAFDSGFPTAVQFTAAVELPTIDSGFPTAVDSETPAYVSSGSPTAVGSGLPTAVQFTAAVELPTVDSGFPTFDSVFPTTVDPGFTATVHSEFPGAVDSDENPKRTIVLDTADIEECFKNTSYVSPWVLFSHSVVVDIQNLSTLQTEMCYLQFKHTARYLMSVEVPVLDCNSCDFSITEKRHSDSNYLGTFNQWNFTPENTCIYSLPNLTLTVILTFREQSYGNLLMNVKTLPDFHRILTVEFTNPLNGSVSTPGWDGVTSSIRIMDTWASVAIPAGHEVMLTVVQLDIQRCSPSALLAVHEYPDTKPFIVYCGYALLAPLARNSSSGNIVFHYVMREGYTRKQSTGFMALFSLNLHASALRQLSDGTWNCSVSTWSQFRHLFPCNFQAECAGGEDEALCPYATAHCGAGRLDLAGFCFVYITANYREESDSPFLSPRMSWNMAEERCRRAGGHLASLSSYRKMAAVTDFARGIPKLFVGLVPSGSSIPFLYKRTWMHLDETVAHYVEDILTGVFERGLSVYLERGNIVQTPRDQLHGPASALCDVAPAAAAVETLLPPLVDDDRGGGVDSVQAERLLPNVSLDFEGISHVGCPQGHVTHACLACDADSACWAHDRVTPASSCGVPMMTPLPPSMTCDNGVQSVPYTLVCDRRPDCADRSDEDFCAFDPCDVITQFVCADKTCLPIELVCDSVQDCLDGNDEIKCPNYFLGRSRVAIPPPAILEFDGRGSTMLRELVVEAVVTGTAIKETLLVNETPFDGTPVNGTPVNGSPVNGSPINGTPVNNVPVCPDTHFQCAVNDYCVPVFTRCNDVYDCPGHEDEVGCDSYTCPGFYRCRGSRICLHEDDLCDGVFHCPQGDDEKHCDLACPVDCTCYGLAFICPTVFPVAVHPQLRYLDASGSGMNMTDVRNNSWLIYLSLVHCGVRDWAPQLVLPNLRTLDLSNNNVTVLSADVLHELPNLRHLALAHNPLTSFISSPTKSSPSSFPGLRSLDVSGSLMGDVSELWIFPRLHELNLTGCGMNRLPRDGFRPLFRLRVLDLRGCPLVFFPRAVFQGLDDLTAVYADNYKLCCPAVLPSGFNHINCVAPTNEVSSCESLLRSNIFRGCLYAFAIMAYVGNVSSLIFRTISGKSRFKTGFDIFVANLCVSDLLMGVYLTVIGVADRVFLGTYLWEDITWRHSTACKVAGFVSLLSSQVSAFMISLITLDRFLVLRFPFRQLRFTTFTALLASGVGWVMGLAIATVPLLPWNSDWDFYSQVAICIPLPITRQDFVGKDYAFNVIIVLNFVLFLFIAVGQVLVYMSVQTHKMPTNSETTTALNKDRKLARRLLTVAVSDFLCWFPIGLMAILANHGFPVPGQVNVAMAVFVMPLNSAINPFLYTLNIVLEKRRLSRERRLQQLLLSRAPTRSANNGTSDLSASKLSQQEARRHLRLWIQKAVLSPEQVLLCLHEGSDGAARQKMMLSPDQVLLCLNEE